MPTMTDGIMEKTLAIAKKDRAAWRPDAVSAAKIRWMRCGFNGYAHWMSRKLRI